MNEQNRIAQQADALKAQEAMMAMIQVMIASLGKELKPEKDKEKPKFRKINEKQYKKVDKFNGEDKGWKAFDFNFLLATKMVCQDTVKIMKDMCLIDNEMSFDEYMKYLADNPDPKNPLPTPEQIVILKERSLELYDVLGLYTEGDAVRIVQSVDGDGFAAWQKLHIAYNKMTNAKMMGRIIQVVGPPKVTDLTEMRAHIEDWEVWERDLKNETKEVIPESFRTAILTIMSSINSGNDFSTSHG